MTLHAGTSLSGHVHPRPARGCSPCLASTWLTRRQPDLRATAGFQAPRSVPGYVGDAKDNPKPVLVTGRGKKDVNMSPCTVTGMPGVAACWIREQLDILSLRAAFSCLFCYSLRSAVFLVALGLDAGVVVGYRAANTAMASRIATRESGDKPGRWRRRKRNHRHPFAKRP